MISIPNKKCVFFLIDWHCDYCIVSLLIWLICLFDRKICWTSRRIWNSSNNNNTTICKRTLVYHWKGKRFIQIRSTLYNNNKTTKEKETRDVSIVYKYNLLNFQSLPYAASQTFISLWIETTTLSVKLLLILKNAS